MEPEKDLVKPERVYLSGRHYSALQTLFAVVSAFTAGIEFLEDRAEMAGCLEEMKKIGDLAQYCMDRILLTVPEKKLKQIRTELGMTRLHIRVEPPGLRQETKGFSYIPTDALNDLLNHLCQTECFLCDMTPVESRKCPYRILIDEVLPHEIDGKDREHCKYSDMVLGM